MLDKSIRGEALLDLIFSCADELIEEAKTGGSLNCHDQSLVRFIIYRNTGLRKNEVRTLKFRRPKL